MKFDVEKDIPDLSGRVIVVTGGTDGLGKQTIIDIAKHNPAKVYLAARSSEKAETAIAEIKSKVGASCPAVEFLQTDLSSLESVQAATKNFTSKESRLDILICNAGVIAKQGLTKDGYEIDMGTNHLGHALFIKGLLPTMLKTAKLEGVKKGDTRVVILSSDGERLAPKAKYDFAAMKTEMPKLSLFSRYGLSKLANAHHALTLTEEYPESSSGIRFIIIHPGAVQTNLGSGAFGSPFLEKAIKTVARYLIGLRPVEEGAQGQVWAATWPSGKEGEPVNGEFYHPVAVAGKCSKRAKDSAEARTLWDWTEKELNPWSDSTATAPAPAAPQALPELQAEPRVELQA